MTTVFTALALIASAVFFWQITRDTSLLSGILGVEYSRLMPPERANGEPTWNTIYEELKARTAGEPFAAKHLATAQLLRAVIEVERGRREAGGILPAARQVCANDAENWISRLALASLVDSTMGGKTPPERFEAWREVVEQPSTPKISTLYNQEYDRAWEELLGKHVKRLDVRANLVHWMDHGEIRDHYAALPMIQRRLFDLSLSLRQSGATEVAGKCDGWIRRAFVGLIDSESDAGTRLLCADLAARSFLETEGGLITHPTALAFQKMRADFRDHSAASLADLTSVARTPTVNSGTWRALLGKTLAVSALGALGMGGAITLFFSVLGAVFSPMGGRSRRGGSSTRCSTCPTARGLGVRRIAMLMAVLSGIALAAGFLRVERLHSELCVVAWMLTIVAAGAVFPFVAAGIRGGAKRAVLRFVVVTAIFCGLLALGFVSGDRLAPLYRVLDFNGGALVMLGGFFACLFGIGLVLHIGQFVKIARLASITWMVMMILGAALLGESAFADADWQSITLAGRRDEIAARLGDNWRDKYGMASVTGDGLSRREVTVAP